MPYTLDILYSQARGPRAYTPIFHGEGASFAIYGRTWPETVSICTRCGVPDSAIADAKAGFDRGDTELHTPLDDLDLSDEQIRAFRTEHEQSTKIG